MSLKIASVSTVFQEVPDEISLALEISNCPCHCEGCSSKFLWEDSGKPLTEELLLSLIDRHPGITNVLFMGGDADHAEVVRLTKVIHGKGLKASMFSGFDALDPILLECLDYYKIGRFIMPKGDPAEWHKSNNGPICFPWSNQLMFAKRLIDGEEQWVNITYEFRKEPLGDPARKILFEQN